MLIIAQSENYKPAKKKGNNVKMVFLTFEKNILKSATLHTVSHTIFYEKILKLTSIFSEVKDWFGVSILYSGNIHEKDEK